MRIGIDAVAIKPNSIGGVETYARELVRELAHSGADLVVFVQPGAADHFGVTGMHVRCVEAPRSVFAPKLMFATLQTWLPVRARLERVDLLHHLSNVMCLPFGFRSVITLHDMTLELYVRQRAVPDRRVRRHLARHVWSARHADHVITPSRAAADRIESVTGVPAERISVVPLAPKRFVVDGDARSQLLEPGYFLAIGGRNHNKNLVRLMTAYLASGVSRPLVVAGLPGVWHESTSDRMSEMARGSAGRIQLLDYVPEDRLVDLYRGARALIYPSLEEGFGLPPLEAAFLGVPVGASDLAVHREVMGSAALFFDPHSEEAIARSLRTLDADDRLCRSLVSAGLQRVRRFTWAQTAEQTLDVYRRVLGLPRAAASAEARVS